MTDEVGTTEPSTSGRLRRFSPIEDSGVRVPVLYAGQDLACALAETVFHDLEDDPTVAQEIFRADLLTLRAGTIELLRDVRLADLRDAALATYGVTRQEVVGTGPDEYETTRLWGQAIWDGTDVEGLAWNSRRSPQYLSILLFMGSPGRARRGVDRRADLRAAAAPLPLHEGRGLGEVMTAATTRNVTVIIP